MLGNTTLRGLHIYSTIYTSGSGAGLHQYDDQPLSNILKNNPGITSITLEDNWLGFEGAKTLSNFLVLSKASCSLASLDLFKNTIRDSGAKSLSEGLRCNTSLTYLNVKDNKIGDAGAKALGEGLCEHPRLRTLILESNEIGEKGIRWTVTALFRANTTLTSFAVDMMDWDNILLMIGARFLRTPKILRVGDPGWSLHIYYRAPSLLSSPSTSSVSNFEEKCKDPTTKKEDGEEREEVTLYWKDVDDMVLQSGDQRINVRGAFWMTPSKLVRLLPSLPFLHSIDFGGATILEDMIPILWETLACQSKCVFLEKLRIPVTELSVENEEKIVEVLALNTSLRVLDLRGDYHPWSWEREPMTKPHILRQNNTLTSLHTLRLRLSNHEHNYSLLAASGIDAGIVDRNKRITSQEFVDCEGETTLRAINSRWDFIKPELLLRMGSLTTVIMSNCNLDGIPSAIFDLPGLTLLDLG